MLIELYNVKRRVKKSTKVNLTLGGRGSEMKKGFTLVEIMIVVAIIALLAAIGIPSLLGARRTANEAAARSNIRTLCTELETFAAGAGDGAYPADVAALQAISSAATTYCGATRGGYVYVCTIAAGGYTLTATPVSAQTGTVTYTGTTGGQMTP